MGGRATAAPERPAPGGMGAAGRGTATLRDQAKEFEKQLVAAHSPAEAMRLEKIVKTAIPVVTSRTAVCDPAGVVHPEEALPPPMAQEFMNVPASVRGHGWTRIPVMMLSCL